ncbi:cytochrome oxidase putative small subunit CydP [Roseateles sp.]|uniref:cytochrome oxidase putative small subunit CydP n=1 Tax=Roseateles sp. TaxID=1971397 RepID=UPI002DF87DDF|nr:hypothetical protein [Roseateles sp.]
MHSDERRLVRHLAWVVVIKLLALGGLWWGLMREQRTSPDADAAARHLAATAPLPTPGDSR